MHNSSNFHNNESVNNIQAIITVVQGSNLTIPPVFTVNNFQQGSDIWTPASRETANGELSVDGAWNYYCLNNPIEGTLNLSGSSEAGMYLMNLLNSQSKYGGSEVQPVLINLTINNPNSETQNYQYGLLTAGSPGQGYTSERLGGLTFTIKFPKNTTIPVIN